MPVGFSEIVDGVGGEVGLGGWWERGGGGWSVAAHAHGRKWPFRLGCYSPRFCWWSSLSHFYIHFPSPSLPLLLLLLLLLLFLLFLLLHFFPSVWELIASAVSIIGGGIVVVAPLPSAPSSVITVVISFYIFFFLGVFQSDSVEMEWNRRCMLMCLNVINIALPVN